MNRAAFEGMTGVESRSALIRKTSNNNTHHNTTRSNTKQTNKQTKVIVFNYELYICSDDICGVAMDTAIHHTELISCWTPSHCIYRTFLV